MSQESWDRRAERFDRHPLWTSFKWVTGIVIGVLVITVGLWMMGVISAPLFGRGEAVKRIESAENRIGKQELFEEYYADFQGYQAQLAALSPKTENYSTIKQGLVNKCIDTAASYNAEARKVSSEQFRAVDLPPSLDPQECAA